MASSGGDDVVVDSRTVALLDPVEQANADSFERPVSLGDSGEAQAQPDTPTRVRRADTFGNEVDAKGEPVPLFRMNTYDEPAAEPNSGTSTLFQLIMNFINTVVGAGIVGLPFVFRLCGFYLGLIELVLICVITAYVVVRIVVLRGYVF